VTLPGVDVEPVIRAQRAASLAALQDYTKSRRETAANQRPADTAWLVLLDSLIFQTEAELRWLDLCEARLAQLSQNVRRQGSGQQRGAVKHHRRRKNTAG
jgi:hypothetical protein